MRMSGRTGTDTDPNIISQQGDALARSTSPAALAVTMPSGPPGVQVNRTIAPAPPPPAAAPRPAPTLVVESPGEPLPVAAPTLTPAPAPALSSAAPEVGLRMLVLPVVILAFFLFTLIYHYGKRRRSAP